jgi:hypothetical protein
MNPGMHPVTTYANCYPTYTSFHPMIKGNNRATRRIKMPSA